MNSERGILRGDLRLEDDLQLYGTVRGNVTVDGGHTLWLYGTIAGDLYVLESGIAFVSGTVAGHVRADGQTVVSGMVCGSARGAGLELAGGAIGGPRRASTAGPARVPERWLGGSAVIFTLLPWAIWKLGPYHFHGLLRDVLTPQNAMAVAVLYVVLVLLIIYDIEEWRPRKLLASSASIVGLIYGYVGIWAAIYQQAAFEHPTGPDQCFVAGHLSSSGGYPNPIDSIYYAAGLFSTAGSGGMQPVSPECRYIATIQMALDTAIILLGASALVVRLMQRQRA